MKAILVMFDSLNRRMLEPYGGTEIPTPNFKRLAEHSVTFNNSYAASMPCMPARRELHTGRYNFLHRSWGPIEPFDDSMPEILRENGVHSHLSTDHYHYWEDGGATYHTRYKTYELVRGQEGDQYIGKVMDDSEIPVAYNRTCYHRQDWINRTEQKSESDWPIAKTFANGLKFIKDNSDRDNWFLQIETFDPHEPWTIPPKYLEEAGLDLPVDFDFWHPRYGMVKEGDDVKTLRRVNAVLHRMCDDYLGKVLDAMDEHNLWDDTMLIVNTDHGFLLGEHEAWAKCVHPFWDEVIHTPFFVWDPRQKVAGEKRDALVQTIDIAPTLLDFFGLAIPPDMLGKPLGYSIADDTPVREYGLFGSFGGHINITDGRYVLMRAPADPTVRANEYTLMTTRHGPRRAFFEPKQLKDVMLSKPFSFTKGAPLLQIPADNCYPQQVRHGDLLYDLAIDPQQNSPIKNDSVKQMLLEAMGRLLSENDAPEEVFFRYQVPVGRTT